MMSALFRSEFYTRMKRYWGENISIYDSKVKLFLKQGISRQLGRGWTQFFDLNASIQQLTWSFIFYGKYSTSQSYLWFWPPLILGGSVISAGTIHDLRRVKVPGTGPLWNPCVSDVNCANYPLKTRLHSMLCIISFAEMGISVRYGGRH